MGTLFPWSFEQKKYRRLVELANQENLSEVVLIERQWPDYQSRNRRVQELKKLFRLKLPFLKIILTGRAQ